MKHSSIVVISLLILASMLACNLPQAGDDTPEPAQTAVSPTQEQQEEPSALADDVSDSGQAQAVEPVPLITAPQELIQPADLEYLGAFRLPDGPEEIGWAWGGEALTYYPDGDPSGPNDGFPGSLFGTGHTWNTYVSEISIPVPVVSPDRNLEVLNSAGTLQEFADIRDGMFGFLEIPRNDLVYLPPQGEQESGKLYFSWAQHMGETETNPSHGWSELDLSNPNPTGPWRVGEYWNYVTGDYMFEIPAEWANTFAPGNLLATGRFRDGGQGSLGPPLYAIAPWDHGNPPPPNSTLSAIPLLQYGQVYNENDPAMNKYHHSDEWSGGAWLTAGGKSAVIFVGTKGLGECWYGCMDGTVWPDEPPFPPECAERGWWSTQFQGQMIFYDPGQLSAVGRGELESWQPQPYAVMNLDEIFYGIHSDQQKMHVGAAAFDRANGLLYVFNLFADEDKPIAHVWRIQ